MTHQTGRGVAGALAEQTLEQLQQLDAGRWLEPRLDKAGSYQAWTGAEFTGERVPTLAQLFDSFYGDYDIFISSATVRPS